MHRFHRRTFLTAGLPLTLGLGYGGWKTWQAFGADGSVMNDPRGFPLPKGVKRWLGDVNSEPGHGVIGLAFSPNGKTLALGQENGTLSLWETATGKELQRLPSLDSIPRHFAISPDSKVLAHAGMDGQVHCWNLAASAGDMTKAPQDKELLEYHSQKSLSLRAGGNIAFSADGKTLVSVAPNGPVRFWDPATNKELRQFSPYEVGGPEHQARKSGVLSWGWCALSSDGQVLAAQVSEPFRNSRKGTSPLPAISFWDVTTGKLLQRFREPLPASSSCPDDFVLIFS